MQKTVGTVVKTQDSVDPIAVLTVLPLKQYSSLSCVKEVNAYLHSNTKSQANKQLLEQVQNCTILQHLNLRQSAHQHSPEYPSVTACKVCVFCKYT